uniref:Uncharacterized protein n=1 Tax=Coccidioides posadasii RMSCC 3488 TaxID=454284 RepID=A0A0J6FJA3_COCPO|nr:hypothetical protein CPAG_05247 [Coccidioides posadasii RMSCC 3488]
MAMVTTWPGLHTFRNTCGLILMIKSSMNYSLSTIQRISDLQFSQRTDGGLLIYMGHMSKVLVGLPNKNQPNIAQCDHMAWLALLAQIKVTWVRMIYASLPNSVSIPSL